MQMNIDYGITLILATHSQELAARMKIQYTLTEGKLISGIKD
jgi:predicted ABC-type transport system involved in lysophospholipase L1 biosynthesis ATPase subunit